MVADHHAGEAGVVESRHESDLLLGVDRDAQAHGHEKLMRAQPPSRIRHLAAVSPEHLASETVFAREYASVQAFRRHEVCDGQDAVRHGRSLSVSVDLSQDSYTRTIGCSSLLA